MKTVRVLHLIDDTTSGGIMRMLDHLVSLPGLMCKARQTIRVIDRSALTIGRQDADVIVSHLALRWKALPALMSLRALNANARIIHVEHSYTRAFTALNVKNKKRFQTMLRTSYALFDQIIAVSEGQAEWLRQRNLVREGALSVISPQVDLTEFEALTPPDPSQRVVGAIGRLEPQKGFDILIQAFRMCTLPDARLIIFGDGSERGRLEKLAQSDSRISFRGHTSDQPSAFAEANVIAIPSRWEAFGLVAQEAQASGRYVLAADVDGLTEQASEHIQLQRDPSPDAWSKQINGALTSPRINLMKTIAKSRWEKEKLTCDWLMQFRT